VKIEFSFKDNRWEFLSPSEERREIVVGKIKHFLTVSEASSTTCWLELSLGERVGDMIGFPWFQMTGHLYYLPFDGNEWTVAQRIHLCEDPLNSTRAIFNMRATRWINDHDKQPDQSSEEETDEANQCTYTLQASNVLSASIIANYIINRRGRPAQVRVMSEVGHAFSWASGLR
jgi:hypothetical protein